jgi:hypothetical protein
MNAPSRLKPQPPRRPFQSGTDLQAPPPRPGARGVPAVPAPSGTQLSAPRKPLRSDPFDFGFQDKPRSPAPPRLPVAPLPAKAPPVAHAPAAAVDVMFSAPPPVAAPAPVVVEVPPVVVVAPPIAVAAPPAVIDPSLVVGDDELEQLAAETRKRDKKRVLVALAFPALIGLVLFSISGETFEEPARPLLTAAINAGDTVQFNIRREATELEELDKRLAAEQKAADAKREKELALKAKARSRGPRRR